ncbi:DUF2975 domain-containing protein [Streptomyces axinellae]|uniref:DUF2975 domain-containing protein n=1 Tax=Streptomyces axinellae TaxID=552788 RepID=A0ABN3QJN5_9ACTN
MHRLFITALRVAVAAAILVGLFGQLLVIPNTAANTVENFPPYAPYEVPYVTVAVLGVACVQAALVATWVLLGMVEREAIFTPRAFRWVDVIIGASVVATLLAFGVMAHLFLASIPSPGDGMDTIGVMMGATTCVGVGTAFAMLVVVMRGLLRKSTELQTEMAEVV